MALFQRKPIADSTQQLYTLGAHRTVLIVGLGNTGKRYEGTRHNIGFAVLDAFADNHDFPAWSNKKDLKCSLTIQNISGNRIVLIKPATFMNGSGEAVQAVQHFYKLGNQDTLAVYDELALEFGQLRLRRGGADAGHNGVKSLIEHCGEDFGRLRIGIGSLAASRADAAQFVLGKFTADEAKSLPLIVREAEVLITEFIFSGELTPQTRSVL